MLRHGKTAWNAEKRIQGRTDVPLSEAGRTALTGLALPPDLDAPTWISSPLTRAMETARIISSHQSIFTDNRLIEMNFGDWEGHTHAELMRQDAAGMARLERLGIHMRAPGGETPAEVGARLLDLLRSRNEDALVLVSHKGMIRAALARATGWDMSGSPPEKIAWQMAQTFHFDGDELTVERLNVPLIRRQDAAR
ncbi:MAG: histidine phosphatase family protein [Minwuia sp.]|nr:histidine phosphatase family protein [Minwuia sp.]